MWNPSLTATGASTPVKPPAESISTETRCGLFRVQGLVFRMSHRWRVMISRFSGQELCSKHEDNRSHNGSINQKKTRA